MSTERKHDGSIRVLLALTMNPSLDKSSRVEQVVANRKLRCEAPSHEPGGGGINVARAAVRLGVPSLAVFPFGGPTGHRFAQLLDEARVPTRSLPIASETRESLMIHDAGSTQQYRFSFPGPRLEREEWEALLSAVSEECRDGTVCVASGSLPPGCPQDFYRRTADGVFRCGGRLLLDTWGAPLVDALGDRVFLIKPNAREFSRTVGSDLNDDRDVERAAAEMIRKTGVQHIVVSMGAGGALYTSASGSMRLTSPAVPIESRVGAGDSMMAGIAVGLSRGLSVETALQLGIACGAAAVTTPGSELCRREDAERLFRQAVDKETVRRAFPSSRNEERREDSWN